MITLLKTHPTKNEACHICDEMFSSKGDMMSHKKSEHEEMVPIC